ncbi:MAG TPA: MazG family protein [Verrucomicrobiae bacterium]|nr:MazG family protein [Verrucomicrobiae bacterium]
MKKQSAINDLVGIMARLRGPNGCPWDREQNHRSLRWHAVEEAYELMDAIESADDQELEEELGDLLLQVVFHCQLAKERHAFDLEKVARRICDKLIRRHPHVFGNVRVKDVDQVWANWEKIKRAEKHGTRHARGSVLDGIPKRLPSLMKAEKLIKKARKAELTQAPESTAVARGEIGKRIFELVVVAQKRGWSAEDLLRAEINRRERAWRKEERVGQKHATASNLDKKIN